VGDPVAAGVGGEEIDDGIKGDQPLGQTLDRHAAALLTLMHLCWLVTSSALESDGQSLGQSPGTQGLNAL